MFLDKLKKNDNLNNLESEYNRLTNAYMQQKITHEKVADVLNKITIDYATVKSLYPFIAIPNDVDVLIFEEGDFEKAISQLEKENFKLLDSAPAETWFRDMTRTNSNDLKNKTPFDLDLYKELGASHIIYIDKKKIVKELDVVSSNNIQIKILNTPTELAINIFHSIFPEEMYTLLLHYFILHCTKNMDINEKKKFVQICAELKISKGVQIALSVTEKIQELCFNSIPQEIVDLREEFGEHIKVEIEQTPYHYPFSLVLKAFWGKKSDPVFFSSALKQSISLINPKYAKFVFQQYKWRKNRDTY